MALPDLLRRRDEIQIALGNARADHSGPGSDREIARLSGLLVDVVREIEQARRMARAAKAA